MIDIFLSLVYTMSKRIFTWEGRCYEQKYGNRKLINVYLAVSEEPIYSLLDKLTAALGDVIIFVDEVWYDDDPEWNENPDWPMTSFVTVVVDEKDKAVVFAWLAVRGFQER